jgi:hypothetical protein
MRISGSQRCSEKYDCSAKGYCERGNVSNCGSFTGLRELLLSGTTLKVTPSFICKYMRAVQKVSRLILLLQCEEAPRVLVHHCSKFTIITITTVVWILVEQPSYKNVWNKIILETVQPPFNKRTAVLDYLFLE